MVNKNINNLIIFLNSIDEKIFRDIKDLSSIDKDVLNKFISLNENLENNINDIWKKTQKTKEEIQAIANKLIALEKLKPLEKL